MPVECDLLTQSRLVVGIYEQVLGLDGWEVERRRDQEVSGTSVVGGLCEFPPPERYPDDSMSDSPRPLQRPVLAL